MIWGFAPNGALLLKPPRISSARLLNCDISPDWRTPRALSLRRGAKHAAGGFGVPVPLCAAVGRIENEGPWWYRSAAKRPAQRCLTQINTGQAPWIHLGALFNEGF